MDKLAKGNHLLTCDEGVTRLEEGEEGWAIMLGRSRRGYRRFILGKLGTGGGIRMDSPLSRDSQVLPLKVLSKHIDLALLKGAYPGYLGVTTRWTDVLSATNM